MGRLIRGGLKCVDRNRKRELNNALIYKCYFLSKAHSGEQYIYINIYFIYIYFFIFSEITFCQ